MFFLLTDCAIKSNVLPGVYLKTVRNKSSPGLRATEDLGTAAVPLRDVFSSGELVVSKAYGVSYTGG